MSIESLLAYTFSAFLLLFLGWSGGFLYFKSKVNSFSLHQSKSGSVDIGYLVEKGELGSIAVSGPSLASNNIRVRLDRIPKIEVNGDPNSSSIKPILIQMLKSEIENYASKSKVIDIIAPFTKDPEVRGALLYVMKNAVDPSLRMKAITILAKVAGVSEVKKALLDRLLNDEHLGIRFKSLEIIENNVDGEVIKVLKKLKETEDNEVIKKQGKGHF